MIIEQELRNYLNQVKDFKSNESGIEIHLKDVKKRGVSGEILLILPIDEGKEGKIFVDLIAEFTTVEEFIKELEIKSIDDLHYISPSFCSVQYVKGKGFFSCMVETLGNVHIDFKASHGITIVYSTDLNYYDEVKKALTMPEQLVQYIEEQIERLGTYAALASVSVER